MLFDKMITITVSGIVLDVSVDLYMGALDRGSPMLHVEIRNFMGVDQMTGTGSKPRRPYTP